jgi:diketogulonate reductase-like aldo/keto reductase
MNEYVNKRVTKNREYAASSVPIKNSTFQLKDNRSRSIIQKKANNTGLPSQLKNGIENLSGHSMDDVKVHYNSDKPAQLNAHAYAQGADIHLASGQEKHLPHEAWHVVQQKQGRVKPTLQMKGKVNVNDDEGLEKEADLMGGKALQLKNISTSKVKVPSLKYNSVAQKRIIQAVWLKGKGNLHMRWDKLINGLQWMCNPANGSIYFQIEKIADSIPVPLRERLSHLEYKQLSHEQWLSTGIFELGKWTKEDAMVRETIEEPRPTTRTGMPIPKIGMGTANVENPKVIEDAIDENYRMFDTAEDYHNIGTVGAAISKSVGTKKVTREELFIVYKIKPKKPATFEAELKAAQGANGGYLDAVLLHDLENPVFDECLKILQIGIKSGHIRYVGVSNVQSVEAELQPLMEKASAHGDVFPKISFVQNKFLPFVRDKDILTYCKANNIQYMGFSIFGGEATGHCTSEIQHNVLGNPLIEEAAKEESERLGGKTRVTPGQVALSWALEHETIQIPKSNRKERMKENRDARLFPLHEDSMEKINSLGEGVDIVTNNVHENNDINRRIKSLGIVITPGKKACIEKYLNLNVQNLTLFKSLLLSGNNTYVKQMISNYEFANLSANLEGAMKGAIASGKFTIAQMAAFISRINSNGNSGCADSRYRAFVFFETGFDSEAEEEIKEQSKPTSSLVTDKEIKLSPTAITYSVDMEWDDVAPKDYKVGIKYRVNFMYKGLKEDRTVSVVASTAEEITLKIIT